MIELKVKKLHPDAIIPRYATNGAACFDLHAVSGTGDSILNGMSELVDTGLSFEIPEGHVMLVYSRSGHGFNNATRLANCVGVVDSDFRGEVKVRLTRDSDILTPMRVKSGDRIAQAMIVPIPAVSLVEVAQLSDTDRGLGGFGSTGA